MSNQTTISRRDFLRAAAITAVTIAVSACARQTAAPTVEKAAATATPKPPEPAATATPKPPAPTATTKPADTPKPSGRAKEIRMIAGGFATLDSYLYSGGMYVQCFTGIKEGLVEFGQDLNPTVLQAEKWELSGDGLEYTFKLRKDNKWWDGTPVTAKDYVAAIIEQLTPGRQSKYGWDSPFSSLVGANEFRAGAAKAEDVGAIALDDYTLQFKLVRPRPDFINALVTGSCYPLQKASVDKFGADWVKLENFQGNGPYKIASWVLNESLTLVPNPNYNLPRGNLEKIVVKNQGKPLEAYQAGETDFTGIGLVADLVVAQNDPKLSKEIVIDDTSGLEWMRPIYSEDGFLYDNPKVVRAIAKSLDIASIIEPIWLGLKKATLQMYYPLQPGYDKAFDEVLKPDVAEAKKLLAEAGFPDGKGVPKLQLIFPSYQNQDYISSWTAIAGEVKKNLGIELVLNNMESGQYSQVVYDPLNPAELAGFGFYASGKPWKDPLFGFEFCFGLREFKDSKTYNTYAKMQKEQSEVRAGTKKIEGGSDADFARVLDEIKALREQALSIHDKGGYPASMKKDAEKLYNGWVDAITTAAADAKAGKDREGNWQEVNAALLDAKADVYAMTNRTADYWNWMVWRIQAQETTNQQQQAELAKKAFSLTANSDWYVPLWVMQSVHLVRPYVQGLRFNPFWWGTQMYMKWVNIV